MVRRKPKELEITQAIYYAYDDKVTAAPTDSKLGNVKKKNDLTNYSFELPQKAFYPRESVMTVIFENPHVRTVYHIAIVLFLGLCFITFARGYLEDGVASGFRIIAAGFRDVQISLLIWFIIYGVAFLAYLTFRFWSRIRLITLPRSTSRLQFDIMFCALLVIYYGFSLFFIGEAINNYNLPTGSAAIILMEQIRLLMKVHAFVRSNVPIILLNQRVDHPAPFIFPSVGNFIYFTWVPTLVYKDEYPRSARIRWKRVFTYIFEILAVVVGYSCFLERYLIPLYKDFGIKKFSRTQVFLAFLESIFPGALFLVVTFYLILHLVQNLFAELLCFSDRMFYKDWWTCTDFPTYYRKWNVVVHDWLYEYIYKDCYDRLGKTLAKYVTFLLSSLVHEWVIANMLGYCLPIMFVQFFGVGTLLTYVKFPKYAVFNMLFWLCLALGSGLMITAYGLEFYARFNDVPRSHKDYDFFIPRLLTCRECYSD